MFDTLIVDDNAYFRQTMKKILLSHFSTVLVLEARDGKEAFREIENSHPSLVFMDLSLPGENGLELTRKIKSLYPGISVVVLTSHDSPEYRNAAARSGAEYFLAKGKTKVKEIVAIVESIFARDAKSNDET